MGKLALVTSCIFKQARAAGGEESSILGGGAGGRWRCEQSGRDGEAPPGDIDPFPLGGGWGSHRVSVGASGANASLRVGASSGIQRRPTQRLRLLSLFGRRLLRWRRKEVDFDGGS